jgi:septum formation protein
MTLILGSQSPRRREILSYFDLPFVQIESAFDEHSITFAGDPIAYVKAIAMGKANALHLAHPREIIVTADTIVYCEGKTYGKPRDEADAIATLSELAGRWHSVFTAVAVRRGVDASCLAEETRIQFNPLTPEQIQKYHDQLHLYDKAGSYQIQMAGGLIVRKIEGCYYNAVGLPINTLRLLLKQMGIDLWDHLKQ